MSRKWVSTPVWENLCMLILLFSLITSPRPAPPKKKKHVRGFVVKDNLVLSCTRLFTFLSFLCIVIYQKKTHTHTNVIIYRFFIYQCIHRLECHIVAMEPIIIIILLLLLLLLLLISFCCCCNLFFFFYKNTTFY